VNINVPSVVIIIDHARALRDFDRFEQKKCNAIHANLSDRTSIVLHALPGSPLDDFLREVLIDELHVIWLEVLNLGFLVRLAV